MPPMAVGAWRTPPRTALRRRYVADFARGARRFDQAGRPNPILLPMVRDALEHVLHWQPLAPACAALTATCAERAAAVGCTVNADHAPHMCQRGKRQRGRRSGGERQFGPVQSWLEHSSCILYSLSKYSHS